jgi:hypothetical protein
VAQQCLGRVLGRRGVIAGLAVAAVVGRARAQQPSRPYRIALLSPNPFDPIKNPFYQIFLTN